MQQLHMYYGVLCMCVCATVWPYLRCFFCWTFDVALSLTLYLFLSLSSSLTISLFVCFSLSSFVSLSLHLLNPAHLDPVCVSREKRPANVSVIIIYSWQGTECSNTCTVYPLVLSIHLLSLLLFLTSFCSFFFILLHSFVFLSIYVYLVVLFPLSFSLPQSSLPLPPLPVFHSLHPFLTSPCVLFPPLSPCSVSLLLLFPFPSSQPFSSHFFF